MWQDHLRMHKKNPVIEHDQEPEDKKRRQFLLKQGEDEPIYDTPFTR